ncbi:unnamed protein product [Cylindrotheca closterium]|uniref:Uncharacterized protein n=1 Tax=Cylindrotheca closterium TaxID=2856 RepID=A0AAD2G702_9STRA|nr:unnamed protein product [Cylindrotheca closterium]
MVDFVDLANGHRYLLERILGAADDDFAKIENDYPASNGFQYETTTAQSSQSALDSSSYYTGSTPVLSKSAEAELYLLATNFLLYVAMVIITIMVAKIYFPESLKRGHLEANFDKQRPYSYRRKSSYKDSNNESSEEEDLMLEYDVELEEDELEALYSDEDEEFLRSDDSSPSGDEASWMFDSDHNFLEFDQEQASRSQVVKRLLFCSLMLNITFVTWGVLQERMLTRRYPRHTGDFFTYSYALVFSNRFWTLVMSGMMLLWLKPRASRTTILYEYSFPSISNMLSSWCQYEALRYLSFPATTIFKSFKLAPVMLMGKLLGNKTYPVYDYVVALVIGIGIAMFMSSTDDLSWGTNYLGTAEVASAKWTGVMLLCLFLFFDSFTSQFQSRMFQRHVDLSMIELMFATSAFSTVLSLITLIHTHELGPALEFVYQHSEIHLHFFMFSICSTIGQLFIFYTIKNFGAVVFTLIMTTRILLSIALSCFLYGHQVSGTGFLGLMAVFGAVLYRIRRKAEGNQLIKWQGIDDEKGGELFSEWHEHLDM